MHAIASIGHGRVSLWHLVLFFSANHAASSTSSCGWLIVQGPRESRRVPTSVSPRSSTWACVRRLRLRTYTSDEAGPHDDGLFVHHLRIHDGIVAFVWWYRRSVSLLVPSSTSIRSIHLVSFSLSRPPSFRFRASSFVLQALVAFRDGAFPFHPVWFPRHCHGSKLPRHPSHACWAFRSCASRHLVEPLLRC